MEHICTNSRSFRCVVDAHYIFCRGFGNEWRLREEWAKNGTLTTAFSELPQFYLWVAVEPQQLEKKVWNFLWHPHHTCNEFMWIYSRPMRLPSRQRCGDLWSLRHVACRQNLLIWFVRRLFSTHFTLLVAIKVASTKTKTGWVNEQICAKFLLQQENAKNGQIKSKEWGNRIPIPAEQSAAKPFVVQLSQNFFFIHLRHPRHTHLPDSDVAIAIVLYTNRIYFSLQPINECLRNDSSRNRAGSMPFETSRFCNTCNNDHHWPIFLVTRKLNSAYFPSHRILRASNNGPTTEWVVFLLLFVRAIRVCVHNGFFLFYVDLPKCV